MNEVRSFESVLIQLNLKKKKKKKKKKIHKISVDIWFFQAWLEQSLIPLPHSTWFAWRNGRVITKSR